MSRRSEDWSSVQTLVIWVGIALVVRLAYLVEQGTTSVLFYQPMLDEEELARAAEALLAGEGFGAEPLFKAPLYAVFLAVMKLITGDAWFWTVRLVQHLCGAALAGLAFDTARRILGRGAAAAVAANAAAALVVFYGPLVRLENRLILDFFVVFFQSALLWALIRSRTDEPRYAQRWIITAGVLAALAWLTRPTITVALPFIALWIFGVAWRGNRERLKLRARQAGLFLLFPALAMAGVTLRNATVGGEAMVLPWQSGYAWYHANRTGANGRFFVQTGFVADTEGNPTRQLMEQEYLLAAERGEIEVPEARYYAAIDQWWKDRTWQDIRADPQRWMRLMVTKTVLLTNEREIFNFESYDIQRRLSVLLPWLVVGFGVVWPLALASAALVPGLSPGRRRLYGLLVLYGVTLGGGIALYYVSGRLRMPLAFPAIIMAAVAVGLAVARLRGKRLAAPLLAGALILAVIGTAMSWSNWDGARTESQAFADYARLSNAAWKTGQHEMALEFAELAAEEKPDYPALPQLRAQALYGLERYEDAEAAFVRATEEIANDPRAPFNLGIVRYYDLDDPTGAVEAFQEAARRGHPRAPWLLAKAAIRAGQLDLAQDVIDRQLNRPNVPEANMDRLTAEAGLACALGNREAAADLARRIRSDSLQAFEEFSREMAVLGCPTEELLSAP